MAIPVWQWRVVTTEGAKIELLLVRVCRAQSVEHVSPCSGMPCVNLMSALVWLACGLIVQALCYLAYNVSLGLTLSCCF